MTNWNEPKEVPQVDFAFPGDVIGKYLPEKAEIPSEFWETSEWSKLAHSMFSDTGGLQVDSDNESIRKVARHLSVCLRSFQPKHEHKIAGVAYLASLWLEL